MTPREPIVSLAAGGVLQPLVRPLPVILAYVEALEERARGEQLPAALAADVRSHVEALAETVEATSRAGVPKAECEQLARLARALPPAGGRSKDPVARLNAFLRKLEEFSKQHRDQLRRAFKEDPEAFRSPYAQRVRPRVLGLWGYREDPDQAGRLVETLASRCQYRVERVPVFGLRRVEPDWSLVGIAPTEERIPDDFVDQALALKRPVVAFLKTRPTKERGRVPDLRAAHGLARRGIHLIHPPHHALRLFQKLDRIDFLHRLAQAGEPSLQSPEN